MIVLAEGKQRLEALIANLPESTNFNEAQTRFSILDIIIKECFGWNLDEIKVENHQDREFTDYELGNPRRVIWEAKREGITFDFPPRGDGKKLLIDLPSLIASDVATEEAIMQVQQYCSRRGVPIAVVSNGHQFITYLASRSDGVSPLEAKALVFDSLNILLDHFPFAWKMLSKDGVNGNNLIRYLTTGDTGVPKKPSEYLHSYPRIRFSSELHVRLRQLAEVIIQDAIESDNNSRDFYEHCYCESGALSKYSMLSKEIITSRYASLFPKDEPSPSLVPVKPDKATSNIVLGELAATMSNRPIVLIGDVGVGKTSFMKNLFFNRAYEEFQNALYIYIDLGRQATLAPSLKTHIINEIENQLFERYGIDIHEDSFIRGVYASEIQRFAQSKWKRIKDSDPAEYNRKLLEMLDTKECLIDQHLKLSVKHISFEKKKQIIICIDNADQRDFNIQQDAFIISQEFAREWETLSFISVRPQTFFRSKRAGALSAYPHKVFTINPPRIDKVLKKRLDYAIKITRGEVSFRGFDYLKLELTDITLFMEALLCSLSTSNELAEFLENITNGNVRSAIELIVTFIGSPNVDVEKIINIVKTDKNYRIPLHEFTKQAILGDFSHYEPESSRAMNVYDVNYPDQNEHFLALITLAYLDCATTPKDKDSFVMTNTIVSEFHDRGFTLEQIENMLRQMTNKKLIETSQRVTFEEDESGLKGDLPSMFRITAVGIYHLKRWCAEFTYLDAMLFDTPIFSSDVSDDILKSLESFTISDRFRRTSLFKQYLINVWNEFRNKPPYFSFSDTLIANNSEFEKVSLVVRKNELTNEL